MQLFAWADFKQGLAILNRLAVVDHPFDDLPGDVAFDFVHQLHGFDDAEHLALYYVIAGGDERRCAR